MAERRMVLFTGVVQGRLLLFDDEVMAYSEPPAGKTEEIACYFAPLAGLRGVVGESQKTADGIAPATIIDMQCSEALDDALLCDAPICESCQFWGLGSRSQDSGERLCGHPKMRPSSGLTPEDGAMDGEAYHGIYTGPKFGCIHHTQKYA